MLSLLSVGKVRAMSELTRWERIKQDCRDRLGYLLALAATRMIRADHWAWHDFPTDCGCEDDAYERGYRDAMRDSIQGTKVVRGDGEQVTQPRQFGVAYPSDKPVGYVHGTEEFSRFCDEAIDARRSAVRGEGEQK